MLSGRATVSSSGARSGAEKQPGLAFLPDFGVPVAGLSSQRSGQNFQKSSGLRPLLQFRHEAGRRAYSRWVPGEGFSAVRSPD